jgi:transposase
VLIAADVRAYICREPVDMRKSIDGLSYLVEPLLAQNPVSGNLFVFVGRDRSKVKCLYWDRTGFALWYKRLERRRFPSPLARNAASRLPNSMPGSRALRSRRASRIAPSR